MNLRAQFALTKQTHGDFLRGVQNAAQEMPARLNFQGTRLDGQLPEGPPSTTTGTSFTNKAGM